MESKRPARRGQTSSATISTLEGIVGRSISNRLAEGIAQALELSPDDLFTTEAPSADRIGQRARPATRPQDRYDGSRKLAEAEAWRCYLDRVRGESIYEWGEPLSAMRAAQRFGLDPHTLSHAARARRVPALLLEKPDPRAPRG